MSQRFYDLSAFPHLERLAQNWTTIRDEYENLEAPILDIDRVEKSHIDIFTELRQRGGVNGWLQGWSPDSQPNPHWLSYGLIVLDQTGLDVRDRMPRTTEMLLGIKGIKVCALNRLHPNTLLSTHTHPELPVQGLLQYHLCLTAADDPNFNYLNVDGEFVQQTPGKAYIFDGSLSHFALNATDQDRVILYMEFFVNQARYQQYKLGKAFGLFDA